MGCLKLTGMSQAKMCVAARRSSKSKALGASDALGLRLALHLGQALVLAVLGLASGCLVTDPIDFEPPRNNPPAFVIEQRPKLQVGDILFVDNTVAPSWTYTFRVRDADVTEPLEVHWRIINGSNSNPRREPTLPLLATGSTIREFDIVISRLNSDECHRIELAVSGSFRKPFEGDEEDLTLFLDRSDRDDLAVFTFHIWEGESSSNDSQKLVDTCLARSFEPSVVTGGAAGEDG